LVEHKNITGRIARFTKVNPLSDATASVGNGYKDCFVMGQSLTSSFRQALSPRRSIGGGYHSEDSDKN
jgi:hypothetical protein